MPNRLSIRMKSACLLWVYAFLLLSQAVHALAPHADDHDAHAPAAVTVSSGCEGPCDDPHHHHHPVSHDDHCTICKVAGQSHRLAPPLVALVGDDARTGSLDPFARPCLRRDHLAATPARAPPFVG